MKGFLITVVSLLCFHYTASKGLKIVTYSGGCPGSPLKDCQHADPSIAEFFGGSEESAPLEKLEMALVPTGKDKLYICKCKLYECDSFGPVPVIQ